MSPGCHPGVWTVSADTSRRHPVICRMVDPICQPHSLYHSSEIVSDGTPPGRGRLADLFCQIESWQCHVYARLSLRRPFCGALCAGSTTAWVIRPISSSRGRSCCTRFMFSPTIRGGPAATSDRSCPADHLALACPFSRKKMGLT